MKKFIDENEFARKYKANKDFRYLENSVLIPNGFIKLVDEKAEYIAFNPQFNILFYLPDVYNYSYERYCFYQPFKDNYGHDIRANKKYSSCTHSYVPFPVFTKDNYLNITNLLNGFENYGYEASLKRISEFPILMEAIGEENRQLVYKVLSEQKVKTLKKI